MEAAHHRSAARSAIPVTVIGGVAKGNEGSKIGDRNESESYFANIVNCTAKTFETR